MQASFTDLVGTAVVPAHCFDNDELTNLTPVLDTENVVDLSGLQAGRTQTDSSLSPEDRCRGLTETLTYGWSGC